VIRNGEFRISRNSAERRRLCAQNIRFAQKSWAISSEQLALLRVLTKEFQLSIARGDLRLLDGKWYVTHAGLLRLAQRRHCSGIETQLRGQLSDPVTGRWVFRATVYKTPRSRGFVGYGDADPSNVSPLVRGAEMRVAETRAVNRALRKAYGIGLCSVEELGYVAPVQSAPQSFAVHSSGSNGNGRGEPRLRDRLCLLIRQHNLDPSLVKAYAADFCGTATLKDTSRELVESFISHLAAAAKDDRDALVCKLNSYAPSSEVKS